MRSPPTFTGKSGQCSTFFAQLALIFIMHPESFANDNTKITYAINNMGGSAFKYFQPYLNDLGNNNIPLPTFGDSNPIVNAEVSIRSLRQTSSVAIYATEFRRISLDLKWNDAAIRDLSTNSTALAFI
ncbi:hypothetical protein V8B55DRAFT_1436989 [Mucor lusitanicus]